MHKTKVSLGLVGLYQISYVIDSNNGTRNYATIRKKKKYLYEFEFKNRSVSRSYVWYLTRQETAEIGACQQTYYFRKNNYTIWHYNSKWLFTKKKSKGIRLVSVDETDIYICFCLLQQQNYVAYKGKSHN